MLKNIYLALSVLFTLIIGSLASSGATDPWYLALNKAPLNPPGYVFGIVWPILYVLMYVVATRDYQYIKKLFYLQLFFNLIWSWLFFYFHLPLVALVDILILILINLNILINLQTRVSYALYLPYIIWLFFAAYLNTYIIIFN